LNCLDINQNSEQPNFIASNSESFWLDEPSYSDANSPILHSIIGNKSNPSMYAGNNELNSQQSSKNSKNYQKNI